MKIPLPEALEVAQMIVPEIDLGLKTDNDRIQVTAVPLCHWHFYLNAMENASDMLLHELSTLPDIKPITELEPIAQDLSCLITTINTFYFCMMDDLAKINDSQDQNIERFSKYRKKVDRPEKEK